MKGISKGKRTRAAILFFGVLLTIGTAACQPTPEQPVVVNKNKDLVEQVKNEAPTPSDSAEIDYSKKLRNLVLPDHYTFHSEDEKKSLVINVDADVEPPEAGMMPLARLRPLNFSQDMVTGMFNYLFPDKKPYLPREQLTKPELEEQILYFQGMLSKGEVDGDPIRDEDREYFQRMIDDYKKQWETAPEKDPELVVSDGTLQYQEQTGKQVTRDKNGEITETEVTSKYYELNVLLDETSLRIGASADESRPGSSLSFDNTDRNFSTDGMKQIAPGESLPQPAQEKMKLSLADAIEKADGFFAAAGIDDVKFFASYIVDDHGTGHVDNNFDPASHYAYKLYYTRTVNGVPVSCHESDTSSGGEFSEPWFYESIEFLVSDDGILEINWMEPSAVTEIASEDVDLIDFETAMKAFENGVTYTYGQYILDDENVKTLLKIEIDNIQLNLVRLKEKDKPGEKAGLYVPAYVFYGTVKQMFQYKNEDSTDESYMTSSGGGNDFYPGPFMVIAVNAIDGSIIDTMNSL